MTGHQIKLPLTYSDVFLLAIETHANVIPQRSTLGGLKRCHTILNQRDVKVAVQLQHTASSQNCLHIRRLKSHRVAKMLERYLILAFLNTNIPTHTHIYLHWSVKT